MCICNTLVLLLWPMALLCWELYRHRKIVRSTHCKSKRQEMDTNRRRDRRAAMRHYRSVWYISRLTICKVFGSIVAKERRKEGLEEDN